MRIALLAATLLMPLSEAASLTGSVVDSAGASIKHAAMELASAGKKYETRADDAGAYQFSNLPAGEYTLTILAPPFKQLTVKSIGLLEREEKRIPEITLTVGYPCGGQPDFRDFARLLPDVVFGQMSGSVVPAAAGVDVILICRTFHACGSAKTDSSGHFSFGMLSAGVYGLSFHRDGFFPEEPTGYAYYVNAGVESVYTPLRLEQCPDGNCEAKIQRTLPSCE